MKQQAQAGEPGEPGGSRSPRGAPCDVPFATCGASDRNTSQRARAPAVRKEV